MSSAPLQKISIATVPPLTDPPFRWNIARREQLGELLEGETEATYIGFQDDLIRACAQIVASAGDANLVFLGRSPENLFDLSQGLLQNTSWQERTHLLPFSMHLYQWDCDLPTGTAMAAYRDYLETRALLPEQIAASGRVIAFADIVASGSTFHALIALLKRFSEESGVDWNAVRRKIRIVGVCRKEKTSPKTWRWQQHAPWLGNLMGGSHCVKNVSINGELYHYLADYQPKTTSSYPSKCWGEPVCKEAVYKPRRLAALRFARALYEAGTSKQCRIAFARALSEQCAMREPWLRHLVGELKRSANGYG
ncbi:MAG: hypothetical protein H8F28_14165 [Fibrella sp.]|nr:hypothetical protein [Armatimonadota bacterium]